MKDMCSSSSSWASSIKQLLYEYRLASTYQVFMDPPEKGASKDTITQAVYSEWTERLQTEVEGMSTMAVDKPPELCYRATPSSLGKHPLPKYSYWSSGTNSQALEPQATREQMYDPCVRKSKRPQPTSCPPMLH